MMEEDTHVNGGGNDGCDTNPPKDKTKDDNNKPPAPPPKLATMSQVFSFGRNTGGPKTFLLLSCGIIFAAVAGCVGPFMVFYFAKAYSDLSGDATSGAFMERVRELSYTFLVLGAVAFLSLSAYSACLQTSALCMANDLKQQWYAALLRQDMAYFDVVDISGTATSIGVSAAKYQRGVGQKLGMLIQFCVTFAGGLIYAFYASWQTSLVTLLTVPFMVVSGWFLVTMNTSQSQRANTSYQQAGSIVYTTVTNIRTILSLNGATAMIQQFQQGTNRAYQEATQQVALLGLANGSVFGSFLLSSIAIPLYGGYLLYSQVQDKGCDPSGAMITHGVATCDPSGQDIFGAMFGIFFAASVLPQISTTIEAIMAARAACYLAFQVMERNTNNTGNNLNSTTKEQDEQQQEQPLRRRHQAATTTTTTTNHQPSIASLPKYVIDSSSPDGIQPSTVRGEIQFHNVTFAYPTRQETQVLQNLNLTIRPGTTLALVGSSGSGKSTIAQLIERFYDPSTTPGGGGKITLDGNDLTTLNVSWLRNRIGLVSQEPSLFACSIRENIVYGANDPATITQDRIDTAAKAAQCYDFITQDFPDGFDTQVGNRGTKLSGGQKQRICIARCLIRNPSILIFDEATSALDGESERLVQAAIDDLLKSKRCTSIIVAHRLSTIRNADTIAVMKDGRLVETGSHAELMNKGEEEGEYYNLVQAQQTTTTTTTEQKESSTSTAPPFQHSESSGVLSVVDDDEEEEDDHPILQFHNVGFRYPSRPDTAVLRNFNLSVRRGETLALVGPSGHGKSTVIQLLERFYDPLEGSIDFDGVPLQRFNPKWLRSQIGLVSQEPTLFDNSIQANITFGLKSGTTETGEEGGPMPTQKEVEEAAREANAASFIESFPDRYETQVGEGGTQVSGGQKQRICIARILLRKVQLLLLDEATSALDSESEQIVQDALDRVIKQDHQTTIVIAHRLSTIRNADRIAVVIKGRVAEIGTFYELMAKQNGHFRRLQAFQNMDDAPMNAESENKDDNGNDKGGEQQETSAEDALERLRESARKEKEKKEQEKEELEAITKEKEKRNASRAREFARGNEMYFVIGSIGALLAGAMFPAWGLIFAYMVELLYTPVFPCDQNDPNMDCQAYWDEIADDMKDLANSIAIGSAGTIVAAMLGYVLLFYGFGTATENLNKRVRDAAFEALVRQEVAWFDVRPVGKLTSQLQEDAALIHSFSGEPIRTLMINLSSVVVGIILGFFYMWPFALMFMGILPFMGFGAEMEMKMYYGEDEGDDAEDTLLGDDKSPGGIVIESLINIRSVASLGLETTKLKEYGDALEAEHPHPLVNHYLKGCGFGLGQFFQFWGLALMFWFGAWILHNHPETYTFRDFLVAMFALFFSLYGLTVALEGATDQKKAKLAADRIFDLIDRTSAIDPLSEDGIKGTDTKEALVAKEEAKANNNNKSEAPNVKPNDNDCYWKDPYEMEVSV